ncbi:MAG: hypothetical protein OXC68_00665 [Aestuariivita sp.]|nr:hypothetical protein [Aestuariivita sp.]
MPKRYADNGLELAAAVSLDGFSDRGVVSKTASRKRLALPPETQN